MSETKVITGKVRFSYVHVWEPTSMNPDSKPKYSVSLIIPKSDKDGIAKVKKGIAAALEAGKEKFGGKIPAKWNNPLRDGDEDRPDDEAYADSYFINASSFNMPGVVDKSRNEIIDKEDFYSGCYGKASINFYAYNTSGNKGVAAGLNNLLKLADGEPLGGVASKAEDDFADEFGTDDLL